MRPRMVLRVVFLFVLSGWVCQAADATAPPIISAQATAANAAFLAYAPPPPVAGAMCLVDTGVHPTPDTGPALAYATALDGGTPDDTDPEGHGTMMAMLAGGRGHGITGIWPQIKIVSIRAASAGQQPTYEFENYIEAMKECSKHVQLNIKTVNLSLSSTIPPTLEETQAFAERVNELIKQGVAIVAAAGNSPGKVQYPAAEPGVLSVAAGTLAGGMCSFSATEGALLTAPGCELDFADPFQDEFEPGEYAQGTSEAAVIASASLTALMSYAPKLTVGEGENLLVTTASSGHLDVAGAFEAAGLGALVAAGNAAIPTAPSGGGPVTTPSTQAIPRATVKSLTWTHGLLTLRLRSLPSGMSVHLEAVYANHRKSRGAAGSKLILRLRCLRPRQTRVWITQDNSTGPASIVPLGFHFHVRRRHHPKHHTTKTPRRA